MGCGCKERRERMARAAAKAAERTREFFQRVHAAAQAKRPRPQAGA